MRYNSYRQYVTLNGVKRESKMDVIKNLKTYYKNIMRYIPKTQYDEFSKGHEKIVYRFIVNTDNTIRSLRLLALDTTDGSLQISDAIEINVPACALFNGVYDGTYDGIRGFTVKYYTVSEQELTVASTTVGTTTTSNVQQITCDYHGSFINGPNNIYTVAGVSNNGYYIRIPNTMNYSEVDFNVTNFPYDYLPTIPITVFE